MTDAGGITAAVILNSAAAFAHGCTSAAVIWVVKFGSVTCPASLAETAVYFGRIDRR